MTQTIPSVAVHLQAQPRTGRLTLNLTQGVLKLQHTLSAAEQALAVRTAQQATEATSRQHWLSSDPLTDRAVAAQEVLDFIRKLGVVLGSEVVEVATDWQSETDFHLNKEMVLKLVTYTARTGAQIELDDAHVFLSEGLPEHLAPAMNDLQRTAPFSQVFRTLELGEGQHARYTLADLHALAGTPAPLTSSQTPPLPCTHLIPLAHLNQAPGGARWEGGEMVPFVWLSGREQGFALGSDPDANERGLYYESEDLSVQTVDGFYAFDLHAVAKHCQGTDLEALAAALLTWQAHASVHSLQSVLTLWDERLATKMLLTSTDPQEGPL